MRTRKQNNAADLADLKAQLATVTESLAALLAAANTPAAASYTIAEFCRRNSLSERQYHKLRGLGRGPRTMSTGDVSVRISRAAELDWIEAREREARTTAQQGVNKN
jgi:hypothetical protein